MKRKFLHNNFGQSAVEFAVLLAVVAAALIAMQVYLKRGVQGRLRDLAGQIAPDASGKGAQQYEPGRTTSNYQTTQASTTVQVYDNGMTSTYQDGSQGSSAETVVRRGSEQTLPDTQ